MPRHDAILERLFTSLISGDRIAARGLVSDVLESEVPAEKILSRLFWPVLQQIQNLHRADQLSALGHNYATRLLRLLIEQMQLRLEQKERLGKTVMVVCGAEQAEELGAMISGDLLEAEGYEIYFAGGGIANDELVAQLGLLKPQILLVYGAVPATVPQTRLLIDKLHDIGVCPDLQIGVGGGVFNRAQGLAEEIGADLWAANPEELVRVMAEKPDHRMTPDQRTVGRRRRGKRDAA